MSFFLSSDLLSIDSLLLLFSSPESLFILRFHFVWWFGDRELVWIHFGAWANYLQLLYKSGSIPTVIGHVKFWTTSRFSLKLMMKIKVWPQWVSRASSQFIIRTLLWHIWRFLMKGASRRAGTSERMLVLLWQKLMSSISESIKQDI